MEVKTFVVFQGQSNYFDQMQNHYKLISNKIWSSWKEDKLTNQPRTSDNISYDIDVVLSEYPLVKGISNIFYQQKTTMVWLLKAKELGATHA